VFIFVIYLKRNIQKRLYLTNFTLFSKWNHQLVKDSMTYVRIYSKKWANLTRYKCSSLWPSGLNIFVPTFENFLIQFEHDKSIFFSMISNLLCMFFLVMKKCTLKIWILSLLVHSFMKIWVLNSINVPNASLTSSVL